MKKIISAIMLALVAIAPTILVACKKDDSAKNMAGTYTLVKMTFENQESFPAENRTWSFTLNKDGTMTTDFVDYVAEGFNEVDCYGEVSIITKESYWKWDGKYLSLDINFAFSENTTPDAQHEFNSQWNDFATIHKKMEKDGVYFKASGYDNGSGIVTFFYAKS